MIDENTTPPMDEVEEIETETTETETEITDPMSNPAILEFIQQQITEGIKAALKGKPPKASTVPVTATDKAEFQRMSYGARLKLYQSNPQEYYKLAKGAI